MVYVKTLRLELAHDELSRADPAERSVTQIALACGFTHMSKFARGLCGAVRRGRPARCWGVDL
jgi:transcriptional regulator GlxA family with amidase domain